MSDKPDSKYCHCPFYSVNALARLMTKMADEVFAPTGLTSSYAYLLMAVHDKPGIQPKEICKELKLTPSTVTRLIEKMEHKGLLVRKQSGRSTEVYPTENSQALNQQVKKAWHSLYQKYTAVMGENDPLPSALNDTLSKFS